MSVRVMVEDLETGDTDSAVVGDGDYLVVCTQPAHYTVQAHANGTHVITVKGRKAARKCRSCGEPIGPGTNRADIHSECFACALEASLSDRSGS